MSSRDFVISRHFILALTLMLALVPAGAQADRVIPSQSVESFVNIRAQPDTASARIGVLRPGSSAPYVGEEGQWYAIGMADGSTGYISKDWTERIGAIVPAAPAKPVAASEPAEPVITAAAADVRGERTVLRDAAAAMRSGNMDSAYRQLKSAESAWAGDAGYDYLLGVAALDSGRPGEVGVR